MNNNNGIVFYNNMISLAALTGENIDPDFPVVKAYNNNQGVVCVGLPGEEVIINIFFDATIAISGIVCFNHNLESGDTFKIESSNNEFTDTVLSRDIDPKGYDQFSWNFPHYRVRLQKVSGAVQVGEIYLPANYYQFERNFKYIKGYDPGRKFSIVKTSGPVYRTLKSERKTYPLEFKPVGENQKQKFDDIEKNENVCFIPYPDKNEIFYGGFTFTRRDNVYINNCEIDGYFEESAK